MDTTGTSGSVYDRVEGEHRISNSERVAFKRCRRMWDWQHREHLINMFESRLPLWFGTGFHYALERYHGYNEDPMTAWDNFVLAQSPTELPPYPDVEESNRLAYGMLEHYTERWLPRRDNYVTWYLDGIPQVEVPFQRYIMDCPCHTPAWPVYHVGTYDRIAQHKHTGKLWIQDYKTASAFDTKKLPLDAQVSSYSLFARLDFKEEFEGVLYTQFKKAVADYPERLQNRTFSKNKNAKTTYAHFVQACQAEYGEVPKEYTEYLNYLASLETPQGDNYIRQDEEYRTAAQCDSEMEAIKAEFHDMLNQPSIYKTATRDCSSTSCSFYEPCQLKDKQEDYRSIFTNEYTRPENTRIQSWRTRLPNRQTPAPVSPKVIHL